MPLTLGRSSRVQLWTRGRRISVYSLWTLGRRDFDTVWTMGRRDEYSLSTLGRRDGMFLWTLGEGLHVLVDPGMDHKVQGGLGANKGAWGHRKITGPQSGPQSKEWDV
jgi:hypothetical protein